MTRSRCVQRTHTGRICKKLGHYSIDGVSFYCMTHLPKPSNPAANLTIYMPIQDIPLRDRLDITEGLDGCLDITGSNAVIGIRDYASDAVIGISDYEGPDTVIGINDCVDITGSDTVIGISDSVGSNLAIEIRDCMESTGPTIIDGISEYLDMPKELIEKLDRCDEVKDCGHVCELILDNCCACEDINRTQGVCDSTQPRDAEYCTSCKMIPFPITSPVPNILASMLRPLTKRQLDYVLTLI